MTETKALILTIGGLAAACLGALRLLASLDAGFGAVFAVYLAAICIAGFGTSSIVMHYASKRRGR